MLLCLGEPPVRFLCSCSFLMCIFICWCSSFCCCSSFLGYFTMSPALHSGFSGPWRPPRALSSILTTFDCLFFFIYRERYGLEDIFNPQAFFTLHCFPIFLAQPAFIKASLGAGSYSLKFAGLHTHPQT